jgi:hypothetical protein
MGAMDYKDLELRCGVTRSLWKELLTSIRRLWHVFSKVHVVGG